MKLEKIAKEKVELQNKCQEHEMLNLELQQKLIVEENEKEKLKQQNLEFLLDHNNKFKTIYNLSLKNSEMVAEIESATGSNNLQKQVLIRNITDLDCQIKKLQEDHINLQNTNPQVLLNSNNSETMCPMVKTEIKTEIKTETLDYIDQSFWASIKAPKNVEHNSSNVDDVSNSNDI